MVTLAAGAALTGASVANSKVTRIKRVDRRFEGTVNEVSFFKQYREVQRRDGTHETKYAPMKKTFYSLPAVREQLLVANQR